MKTAQDNNSIVDKVIANIIEDQKELEKQNAIIEDAQAVKREIQGSIRDSRRDLATFVKYASEEQLQRIDSLDFETKDMKGSLNKVAETAFDIMQQSPKGEMKNGDLYEAYLATFKNEEDACRYGEFNIKCRPLFNSQKLIRITEEGKPSQDSLIRVNGFSKPTAAKKAEPAKPTKKATKKTK